VTRKVNKRKEEKKKRRKEEREKKIKGKRKPVGGRISCTKSFKNYSFHWWLQKGGHKVF